MMTASQEKIDPKNKTILVIEDSDDLRHDVIEMLTLEGYTTAGAENGLVGVDQARHVMPDLIVCDIMMPFLDGYGVLQKLREDAMTAAIPFIFLTAKTEHLDQRYGMVLGADDFLTKPFLANELLDSIEAQLKKREEQLAAVNRRIEDLAASIALALPHEFRTPLNTVIGFSEMLQSEAHNLKPDQVVAWSGYIHSAGYRLYRVVENYLLYVRLKLLIENGIEANHHTDTTNSFHLIVHSQANALSNSHNRTGDLVMDVADAPDLIINDEHCTKIVEELIDNAFKFSKQKQQVIVKGYMQDDEYVLHIIDHGRGMTIEQTQDINAFMQFERDHYEQQGLGLGLALVKQMSEIYGVKFTMTGSKDTGIAVTVRFSPK